MKHANPAHAFAAAAVTAGFAFASVPVAAQAPPAPATTATARPRDRMPTNDAEFVAALEATNTAELSISKYLVNRTTDPVVHAFAQHMIEDHSTAAVQLEAATRGTNLAPVPRELDSNPISARGLTTLQSEDGVERDDDYMRMQIPAHTRVLALLQWEAQYGTNAGLKMLAANLIGPMQHHLEVAQTYLAAHNLR